jgi:hypothetical protein
MKALVEQVHSGLVDWAGGGGGDAMAWGCMAWGCLSQFDCKFKCNPF